MEPTAIGNTRDARLRSTAIPLARSRHSPAVTVGTLIRRLSVPAVLTSTPNRKSNVGLDETGAHPLRWAGCPSLAPHGPWRPLPMSPAPRRGKTVTQSVGRRTIDSIGWGVVGGSGTAPPDAD